MIDKLDELIGKKKKQNKRPCIRWVHLYACSARGGKWCTQEERAGGGQASKEECWQRQNCSNVTYLIQQIFT